MKISDLDRQLTIEEPWQYSDGGGGFSVDWQSISADPVVFAALRQIGAADTLNASKEEFTARYVITLRYRDDLRPDYRLRDGDAIYAITAIVDDDASKTWIKLRAEREIL